MTFARPTIEELIQRVESDLATGLGIGALLPRSVLSVIARTHAGTAHELHGHLAYLADQILPDRAAADWLERHADLWGVVRKAATYAGGPVTFTGTPAAVIPPGTELQRADGQLYVTDAEGTVGGGGTVDVDVTASSAGVAGNAAASTLLNLTSPILGVDPEATVTLAGLAGGADQEPDAELLARLELRIQTTPMGGALTDYQRWALAVAGVTRAWSFAEHPEPGFVGLTFAVDSDPLGPIPSAGQVQAVLDYLDPVRPVTAKLQVWAPVAAPLDPTIDLEPSTAAVRAAVEASLEDLLLREARPGGTLPRSRISEAISLAEGELSHVLVAPAGDVVYSTNQLGVLGTVTWI